MKTKACITLALGLLLAGGAQGASAAKKAADKAVKAVRSALKPDPSKGVYLMVGPGSLGLPASVGFEMALAEKNTANASLGGGVWGGSGWTQTWVNLAGGYKWWIASYLPGEESKALQGIFVGPEARVSMVTVSYDYRVSKASPPYYDSYTETVGATLVGGGAQGGYQWMFPNDFYVAGVVDAGFLLGSTSFRSGVSVPLGGTYYNASVKGGYAF